MDSILVVGNPIDGLTFVGPFEDSELAQHYAEACGAIRDDVWHIAELEAPDASDQHYCPDCDKVHGLCVEHQQEERTWRIQRGLE